MNISEDFICKGSVLNETKLKLYNSIYWNYCEVQSIFFKVTSSVIYTALPTFWSLRIRSETSFWKRCSNSFSQGQLNVFDGLEPATFEIPFELEDQERRDHIRAVGRFWNTRRFFCKKVPHNLCDMTGRFVDDVRTNTSDAFTKSSEDFDLKRNRGLLHVVANAPHYLPLPLVGFHSGQTLCIYILNTRIFKKAARVYRK